MVEYFIESFFRCRSDCFLAGKGLKPKLIKTTYNQTTMTFVSRLATLHDVFIYKYIYINISYFVVSCFLGGILHDLLVLQKRIFFFFFGESSLIPSSGFIREGRVSEGHWTNDSVQFQGRTHPRFYSMFILNKDNESAFFKNVDLIVSLRWKKQNKTNNPHELTVDNPF